MLIPNNIKKYIDVDKFGAIYVEKKDITQNKNNNKNNVSIANNVSDKSNVSNILDYSSIMKKTYSSDTDIVYKDEYKALNKAKKQIDTLSNTFKWDKAKIVVNPYELVYISKFKNGVTNYNPVSRSFFKMWELINRFDIFKKNNGINIASIAEGPGGFIEAIINYRMNKNNGYCLDNLNGITLKRGKMPTWDGLIKKYGNKNINLRLGYGDLYSSKSIKSFCGNFNSNMHLVTADGGFNFTNDYINQEKMSYHIIFCEILTALMLQKTGGIFICKIFDIFHKFTIDMLYILYCLYDELHIVKLHTSRVANSEKYIVARGFKVVGPIFFEKMFNIADNWDNDIIGLNGINVPQEFISELGKINTNLVNKQIMAIKQTIKLANRDDIFYNNYKARQDQLSKQENNNDRKNNRTNSKNNNRYNKNNNYNSKFNKKYWNNKYKNRNKANKVFNKILFNKEHIKKAIQWCIDFNMPINRDSSYLNHTN